MSLENVRLATFIVLALMVALQSEKALHYLPSMPPGHRKVLALFAGALSFLGLLEFLSPQGSLPGKSMPVDFVLLPWATLPLAMAVVLLLTWFSRFRRRFWSREQFRRPSDRASSYEQCAKESRRPRLPENEDTIRERRLRP